MAAVALADIGICTVGTLFGAMAVAGRARELLLPLLFLPMAIPIVVGGVGGYLWFLVLYDAIFALLSWAAFEYVVSETESGTTIGLRETIHLRTARPRGRLHGPLRAGGRRSIFFYAPTDADQGFSQRIFYFHVPLALTAYACFGWGAWKALEYLRSATSAPTSRATSRSTRA